MILGVGHEEMGSVICAQGERVEAVAAATGFGDRHCAPLLRDVLHLRYSKQTQCFMVLQKWPIGRPSSILTKSGNSLETVDATHPYLQRILNGKELLLFGIDEADKCAVPLARLIRSIVTHTQQKGIRNIRFVLPSVSPFFREMVDEDGGIVRFVYETITLRPMNPEVARQLVEAKLCKLVEETTADHLGLAINPEVIDRVIALSGGHPHLLQLLGSHLVEHENDDPDGVIDSRDLLNSLRRICYEDRARA
jgi:hypothetical protein